MKKIIAISSLVLGAIGIGLFFQPVAEMICGISGLVLSYMAKSNDNGDVIEGVREWGNYFAWINIIWVCIEIGLQFIGIQLF